MWIPINSNEDVEQLLPRSSEKVIFLFKHSTRCSLSASVKSGLEKKVGIFENAPLEWHLLDLIKFRSVSNFIEEKFNILHESPQIICLKNGNVINHCSHLKIKADILLEWI